MNHIEVPSFGNEAAREYGRPIRYEPQLLLSKLNRPPEFKRAISVRVFALRQNWSKSTLCSIRIQPRRSKVIAFDDIWSS